MLNRISLNFSRIVYDLVFKIQSWLYGIRSIGKVTTNGFIIKKGRGLLNLGNDVILNSNIKVNPVGLSHKCIFYIFPNAKIIIGNKVGISNSLLYARESIIVEDNVLIGGGCQILDNDFHSLDFHNRMSSPDPDIQSKPIIISEGSFIGANSIILKGVIIGKYSIVAAGSVVTKNIPSNEIWGGNPAKFIKSIHTKKVI